MADDSYLARRLLETGNLSQAALKALLAEQEEARLQGETPPPLDALIERQGLVPRDVLLRLLDRKAGVPVELQAKIDEAQADPKRKLGKFLLLDELGHGGMGTVYRAWQADLGRVVAVKVLSQAGDPDLIERFLREARLASRLRHPNIVSVYEFGEAEGQAFFSMDFIDGTSWNHAFLRPPDVRRILDTARTIARALHFAHEQGVVHRDIKPQNILVAKDGKPYLSDFGLARDVHSETRLTLSGAVMGTPAFMSPEQARGQMRDLDARTDVYSLGATIYEALAARPPHQAETLAQAIRAILDDEIRPPSAIATEVPREVDAIVLKCLEKNPVRRYPTAEALAQDLDRFLEGKPVEARPPGLIRKIAGRIHRRPVVPLLALAAVLSVSAFLIARALRPAAQKNPRAEALELEMERRLEARDFAGGLKLLDEFVPAAKDEKALVEQLRKRAIDRASAAFDETHVRIRRLLAQDSYEEAGAELRKVREWQVAALKSRIDAAEGELSKARHDFRRDSESALERFLDAGGRKDYARCRELLAQNARFVKSVAWSGRSERVFEILYESAEPAEELSHFGSKPRRLGDLLYWQYDFSSPSQMADWTIQAKDRSGLDQYSVALEEGGLRLRNAGIRFRAPLDGDVRVSVTYTVTRQGRLWHELHVGGYTLLRNGQYLPIVAPSRAEPGGTTVDPPSEGTSVRMELRYAGRELIAIHNAHEFMRVPPAEPFSAVSPSFLAASNSEVRVTRVQLSGRLRADWASDQPIRNAQLRDFAVGPAIDLLDPPPYGKFRKTEAGSWERKDGVLTSMAGEGQASELHGEDFRHGRLRFRYEVHSGQLVTLRVRGGSGEIQYALPTDRPGVPRRVETISMEGWAVCVVDGLYVLEPTGWNYRPVDGPLLRIRAGTGSVSLSAMTLEEIRGLPVEERWSAVWDQGKGRLKIGTDWVNDGETLFGGGELVTSDSWKDAEAEIHFVGQPGAWVSIGVRGETAFPNVPVPLEDLMIFRLRVVGRTATLEGSEFFEKVELPEKTGPIVIRTKGAGVRLNAFLVRERR